MKIQTHCLDSKTIVIRCLPRELFASRESIRPRARTPAARSTTRQTLCHRYPHFQEHLNHSTSCRLCAQLPVVTRCITLSLCPHSTITAALTYPVIFPDLHTRHQRHHEGANPSPGCCLSLKTANAFAPLRFGPISFAPWNFPSFFGLEKFIFPCRGSAPMPGRRLS